MITLTAAPAAALDESAHDFIATFMAHVATAAGYHENRPAIIARVNVLLLAALAAGDGASSAWNLLHRAITEIVPKNDAQRNTSRAHAYLQSFIKENEDLVR
jgi:hypothetical protein